MSKRNKTVSKKINLTEEQPNLDLGNVYMKVEAKEFEEVVVTQSPISVKNDTLEYRASSFKTKPNAVVEDLLKKLPGVTVDNDGNVTAQGEQVQRIFVDGKRFFGNDPKMATKNLPPDIVEKIQVYDAMSDQSAFSGFDDGTRIKTINITTKKGRKRGYFGRGIAGEGSDGRYEANVNLIAWEFTHQLPPTCVLRGKSRTKPLAIVTAIKIGAYKRNIRWRAYEKIDSRLTGFMST